MRGRHRRGAGDAPEVVPAMKRSSLPSRCHMRRGRAPDHASMVLGQETDLLVEFLHLRRLQLLERFARLSPQSTIRGRGQMRFVYVPGSRPDRVLLVAHADTIWEHDRVGPVRHRVAGGQILSARKDAGIGADDRAGCAMLWALRDLGHSLLITSGEEIGCLAAHWIVHGPGNRDVAVEINQRHRFAVEFDRCGNGDFKCYDVGTDAFRRYCHDRTGFVDAGMRSATDICILCRQICGVNLSVGYYDEHTEDERIVVPDWANTLGIARYWLSGSDLPAHPRVHANRPGNP